MSMYGLKNKITISPMQPLFSLRNRKLYGPWEAPSATVPCQLASHQPLPPDPT